MTQLAWGRCHGGGAGGEWTLSGCCSGRAEVEGKGKLIVVDQIEDVFRDK